MCLPAHSPDIYFIESVWDEIKWKLKKNVPQSLDDDLFRRVDIHCALTLNFQQTLYDQRPCCVYALIHVRSYTTTYYQEAYCLTTINAELITLSH